MPTTIKAASHLRLIFKAKDRLWDTACMSRRSTGIDPSNPQPSSDKVLLDPLSNDSSGLFLK